MDIVTFKLRTKRVWHGTNVLFLLKAGKWVFQLGINRPRRWFGWTLVFAKECHPVKPILEYMMDSKPPRSVYEYEPPKFERLFWNKSPWSTEQEIEAGRLALEQHEKQKKNGKSKN